MLKFLKWMVCLLVIVLAGNAALATPITGNPAADGWTSFGNSLQKGVYVRGEANYGFNTYSTSMTIASGSVLDITDGSYSWRVGDTVLGVGGEFASITAGAAGWGGFSGNAVNSLLPAVYGPKLLAKFGTSASTFSASTLAPGAGNGLGSNGTNGGSGAVQVRASDSYPDHYDPAYLRSWHDDSGALLPPAKSSHIERVGTSAPDLRVARLIWLWDPITSGPGSWEILLNVSLLDRTQPVAAGWTPAIGDKAILSVQNVNAFYTDGLVTTTAIPEPGTIVLLVTGAIGLLAYAWRRRRRAAM